MALLDSRRRWHLRAPSVSTLVWTLVVVTLALGWMRMFAPRSIGGPAGYIMVRGVSMLPTFRGGDLVITHPSASYGKGDIVAYTVPKGEFGAGVIVIHRIIGGSATNGFVIQGDNNGFTDPWHPKPKDVVGKAWLHVPKLGLVLVFLHSPVPLASLATGIAVALFLTPPKEKKRAKAPTPAGLPIAILASVLFLGCGAGLGTGTHQTAPQLRAARGQTSCLASDHPSTEAELVNHQAACAKAR